MALNLPCLYGSAIQPVVSIYSSAVENIVHLPGIAVRGTRLSLRTTGSASGEGRLGTYPIGS